VGAAAGPRLARAAVTGPRTLTVLYDGGCALCRRCRDWLSGQATYLPLELLDAGSPAVRARYGGIADLGAELVVLSDAGHVWVGPPAFVMCLWATRDWREWSYRLSGPRLAPLARRLFLGVSRHRGAFHGGARCTDDSCRHHRRVVPAPPA
jgi:predicted DCC family thiol-disulfide oxidoreductase YuxK